MKIRRRRFLGLAAASSAAALWPARLSAATYRVGVARATDAYDGTRRAITASGEWPAARITGRVVVIKPNLVNPRAAATGATTDPEVVRALVDRALADGAAEVRIVEAGPQRAFFDECGYSFFNAYDPAGRVRLVDLTAEPQTLVPLPGGLAYFAVYLPAWITDPDLVFISAGKLKTHGDAVITSSVKNLFGLPAFDRYLSSNPIGRFAMHDRSLHLTIVDLLRLRPIDFAVVDAVWAMEGYGPLNGTPVPLGLVLAGTNAVSVDRVALAAVDISQRAPRYLDYAAGKGLGPMELIEIVTAGDPLRPRSIQLPLFPPFIEYPRTYPASFDPGAGQKVYVGVWYANTYLRRLEILRLYEDRPAADLIREISPFTTRQPGHEYVAWDGRADDGSLLPPGRYAAHVRAYHASGVGRPADGIGWIHVAR